MKFTDGSCHILYVATDFLLFGLPFLRIALPSLVTAADKAYMLADIHGEGSSAREALDRLELQQRKLQEESTRASQSVSDSMCPIFPLRSKQLIWTMCGER